MTSNKESFLSITDNTSTLKSKFSEIEELTKKVADKTLEELAKEKVFVFPEILKDADDLSKEQMILQSVNDSYRSGNVMGFLGMGKQRLEIRSRFSAANSDSDGTHDESESYDYFLLYMLQRVLNIPNIVDLKTNADRENRLFNWLLFLFPFYLKTAVRKGVFKTYIRRQYNDANVKGAIDVARHIKKNIPFLGRIAYNQREHSGDNYLLKLIRLTIDYIKSKPFGNSLLSQVRDEIQLIAGATPRYAYKDKRKIIAENKKHAVRHAYYHEYRALQQLCLWILQDEKHLIGQGTQQIYGILFDGAWLWEEYINKLIGEYFYHPQNKTGKYPQQLFTREIVGESNGKHEQLGKIFPDFIGKNEHVIADAKYKPIDNIFGSDYQQILAYMFRFDAYLGLFIYPYEPDPNKDNAPDQNKEYETFQDKLFVNKGWDIDDSKSEPRKNVRVIKCGLKIPQPQEAEHYKDYAAFCNRMTDLEIDFKKCIHSNIEKCCSMDVNEEVLAMGSLGQALVDKTRIETQIETRIETVLTSIRNLMETMSLTVTEAMNALKIPEDERQKYIEALSK